MSVGAIVMMLLAMAVLWGGLAFAIWHLRGSESAEDTHRDL